MTGTTLSRRRVLAALGIGAATALAGCTDGGVGIDGEPRYEDGTVGNTTGGNRSAAEMATAKSLAEQETNQGVTPLDVLTLADHEFVLEDGYLGPTVQGTVENTGSDRIKFAEVRVRVYNDDGDQIGRYLTSTGDLDGNTRWEFQVILLESPADIDGYDITTVGTPT